MPCAPAACRPFRATRASPVSKSRSAASSSLPSPRLPPRARDRAASPAEFLERTEQGSMNQHMRPEPIPFTDIAAQRRRLGKSVDDAVARVLDHCQFINGPEVTELEAALAKFCGAKHVVSCASGTDALLMVLMAQGIGPGDAVLCPSFTFCATGEVVVLTGATPVFVDVDEATFNIDANSLKRGIATARQRGLKPRAIIPVDLFGQPADHDAIDAIAEAEGLFVLND